MKESLEKALARRFHIYVQNPNNEVPFTIFRFECGPGWVPLLIEFAQTAERLDVYDVQIGQIKEKWDALRIYFTAAGLDQDALEDIALDIEERSAAICEVCGKHKVVQNGCDHGQLDVDEINARMLEYILEKPVH